MKLLGAFLSSAITGAVLVLGVAGLVSDKAKRARSDLRCWWRTREGMREIRAWERGRR